MNEPVGSRAATGAAGGGGLVTTMGDEVPVEPISKKRRTSGSNLLTELDSSRQRSITKDARVCLSEMGNKGSGATGGSAEAVGSSAVSIKKESAERNEAAVLTADERKPGHADGHSVAQPDNDVSIVAAVKDAPTTPSLNDEDAEAAACGPLQYHCDYCQKDISDVFRVRCAECPDFDLCVGCFTSGVETGSHKNTHNYTPIGRNDLSLFTPDWNADEEIMLLEGVSKYGFGNWAEVADLVAPYNSVPKKKEECERHYYDVHIAPYRMQAEEALFTQPFGPTGTPDITNPEHRRILQERMIGKYHRPLPEPLQASPSSAACKVVGFMPLRGDFDVEYDNDAELILSDIEFRGDETPQERELKLKVLDIYNAKLDERILRKRVVIERGLADWRKVQQSGKKKSKEEADLRNLFRLLVRFNMAPDPEELVQLIFTERKLRQRLDMLQEWQSLGLETYEEVEEYENSKLATVSGLGLSDATQGKPPSARVLSRKSVVNQTAGPEGTTPGCSPTRAAKDGPNHMPNSLTALSSCHPNAQGSGAPITGVMLEAPASQYPGAELLTVKELEFCDQLQLSPVYFLFAKHTLINTMANYMDPAKLGSAESLRLDATKNGALYDFILHTEFDLPAPTVSDIPVPGSVTGQRTSDTSSLSIPPPGPPVPGPASPQSTIRRPRVRRRPVYYEELDDTPSTPSGDEKGDLGGASKMKKTADNASENGFINDASRMSIDSDLTPCGKTTIV